MVFQGISFHRISANVWFIWVKLPDNKSARMRFWEISFQNSVSENEGDKEAKDFVMDDDGLWDEPEFSYVHSRESVV